MTIQYVEQGVLSFGRLDEFGLVGNGSTSREACMHDMRYEKNGARSLGQSERFMWFRSASAGIALLFSRCDMQKLGLGRATVSLRFDYGKVLSLDLGAYHTAALMRALLHFSLPMRLLNLVHVIVSAGSAPHFTLPPHV